MVTRKLSIAIFVILAKAGTQPSKKNLGSRFGANCEF
jgi:hypothetical protein